MIRLIIDDYKNFTEKHSVKLIYTIDKKYLSKFGKHLKKMREGKNMSQEELANLADVSLPQITRIERGAVNPTICTVKSLSVGLGVEMSFMFNFDSE
ncbi:helix-turn-helix transcriptional regulator [Flavobacterium sp. YJ01]|uniref:helix-turn-helix domain-containing protein n=1 Tax=unclassified Flavobacterium TaxID=196869 RepID=UPI0023E38F78|nr:helix-turn-helix transcriptional regulator [Flavobacterium sp. YJ01]WET00960.1 helix-turn-helix transcriptional regulator [Flavobacterium sp. YJ01]